MEIIIKIQKPIKGEINLYLLIEWYGNLFIAPFISSDFVSFNPPYSMSLQAIMLLMLQNTSLCNNFIYI